MFKQENNWMELCSAMVHRHHKVMCGIEMLEMMRCDVRDNGQ